MKNQQRRFVPGLLDILQPLNELLRKDRELLWSSVQKAAFEEVKKILTTYPILALFSPKKKTKVGSSQYGLGALGASFNIKISRKLGQFLSLQEPFLYRNKGMYK